MNRYANWTMKYSAAIQATSNIVTAVGILVAGAALWVSVISLQENKKATHAQTFFSIQRFGFDTLRTTYAEPHFRPFLLDGMKDVPVTAQSSVLRDFQIVLSAYNVISFQRKLGYIKDPEWALYQMEFCGFVTTEGANYYFNQHPIEKSTFDLEFKELIIKCRK